MTDPASRKAFLQKMGGGTAALGLAGLLAACGSSSQAADPPTTTEKGGTAAPRANDIAIVNYALTLEFLEARYYREAIAGKVIKTRRALELAKRFGATEQQHVEALTAAVKQLGGTPAKAPGTDFGLVFEGGEKMTLMVAATIENLGAAAYLGQATRIESKDILAAALAIHSVEARHAAALNELVGRTFKGGSTLDGTIPDGAFAKGMTMQQVLQSTKPFVTN